MGNVDTHDQFNVPPGRASIVNVSLIGRLESGNGATHVESPAMRQEWPFVPQLSVAKQSINSGTYNAGAPRPHVRVSPDAKVILHRRVIVSNGGTGNGNPDQLARRCGDELDSAPHPTEPEGRIRVATDVSERVLDVRYKSNSLPIVFWGCL